MDRGRQEGTYDVGTQCGREVDWGGRVLKGEGGVVVESNCAVE